MACATPIALWYFRESLFSAELKRVVDGATKDLHEGLNERLRDDLYKDEMYREEALLSSLN